MTASQPPAGGTATVSQPLVWSDPARAQTFQHWIERIAPQHRLLPDTVRLASADASFRRYFRVNTSDEALTRIVMDAPPAQENSEPFVHVAGLMAAAGVKAPQVLEWDRDNGFLLLDDLGFQTMLDVIDPADPDAARALFEQAIDNLILWQLASKADVLPPYDRALLERE